MKNARVRLLARKDLDLKKWNTTVRRAPYGLSWWLNATTQGKWYGLVLDDYRAVMPLPVNRSAGPLKLINGAPFTQHQGPFGDYQPEELNLFLKAIPRYWYVRKLAVYPPFPASEAPYQWAATDRTNHELSLKPDYPTLRRNYRGNLRRKLRDFSATELIEYPLSDFLAFYLKHAGVKSKLSNSTVAVLRKLSASILQHGAGNCYHLTGDNDETIAALLLVRHGNRLINLLAASSPTGFRLHGMTRLLDGAIRAHAGTATILDFEGSDLPGVALFFRGFGAERVRYSQMKR